VQFSKHREAVESFKGALQADKEVQIGIFRMRVAQSPHSQSTASGRI